jgi:hypothetical protein
VEYITLEEIPKSSKVNVIPLLCRISKETATKYPPLEQILIEKTAMSHHFWSSLDSYNEHNISHLLVKHS